MVVNHTLVLAGPVDPSQTLIEVAQRESRAEIAAYPRASQVNADPACLDLHRDHLNAALPRIKFMPTPAQLAGLDPKLGRHSVDGVEILPEPTEHHDRLPTSGLQKLSEGVALRR